MDMRTGDGHGGDVCQSIACDSDCDCDCDIRTLCRESRVETDFQPSAASLLVDRVISIIHATREH
jgi:hypothetical protein